MNFSLSFHRQFRWLNLPGALLFALLQRTPAVQVATTAAEFVAASPVGTVLRSAALAAASLGAMHSLAGATQFQVSRTSVTGAVGTAISTIAFTVTGAPSEPPGSFRIGNLPPGLSVPGANGGLLNAGNGSIVGTPTAPGTFTTSILAYEFSGGQGDAFGPATITFTISGTAATAPAFTTQPASQTVNVGDTVTFSVEASGSPAPLFQWKHNNANIAGATSATLTLPSVQPGDAGTYSVSATNSASGVLSNDATLTVNVPVVVVAPVFSAQPVSQTMAAGSTVVFKAAASDATSFQWNFNGAAINGANNAMLVLPNLSAANAGSYTCVAANSAGSATSNAATLSVGNFSAATTGHLINVSILTTAGSGAKALTVGATIGGSGSSGGLPLVVRAVGPGLAAVGVTAGTLADPVLTIIPAGTSTPLATNDNWGGSPAMANAFAAVGAFAIPAASLDSAFVSTGGLNSGGYTVQVTGKTDATGTVIAEIYDAGDATRTATTPRLINLSTLTSIDAGAALAAGFVLRGQSSRTLLVRGIGPSLAALGVGGTMADPKLEFFNNDTGVKIDANDNWGGDAQLTAVMASVGAFPLSGPATKDAVLLITLPPGAYSARISDANGGAGTAIVEVYEVP